jgi:hypothetical protein
MKLVLAIVLLLVVVGSSTRGIEARMKARIAAQGNIVDGATISCPVRFKKKLFGLKKS